MTRQLAITKRATFDFEGWEDCYINYRPYSYPETLALRDNGLDAEASEEAGFEYILQAVKSHVVGGKVLVAKDDGTSELTDLSKDDLDQMPVEFTLDLFAVMTGQQYRDPKAL